MRSLRAAFALAAVSFLLFQTEKLIAGSKSPLGVLTQAIAAHLNEAAAFPGLSFFEGETLSTWSSGKMTARVDGSVFTLGGDSEVSLHRIDRPECMNLHRRVFSRRKINAPGIQVRMRPMLVKPANNIPSQAEVCFKLPRNTAIWRS